MTERNDDLRLDSGVFALDAMSEEQRVRFLAAAHSNADLATEADELLQTAVILGLSTEPVQPPPRLRSDVLAAISVTPQLSAIPDAPADDADAPPVTAVGPPASGSAETKARGRWFTRPITLVAAAAAAVALFLGGGIVGAALGDRTAPAVDDQAASLAQLYAAADSRSERKELSQGGTATLVWSAELGRSAVLVDGLDPLPSGKVYEAWYINDGGAAPAGVFSATGAKKTSWHILDGTMATGDTVGVTVEPEGGSTAPTSDPIIVIPSA